MLESDWRWIECGPTMRGWIERRIETATALVKPALISANRTKETIGTALNTARRAIERLDRVERRLTKIAMPYAARIVVAGVRLHLASLDRPKQWRELLERHSITLRASAKSPAQGAARLMFERAPASTTNLYASAMGWGLEQIQQGHATLDELAELIVEEGGVQAVARVFAKSKGILSRIGTITNRDYEFAVSRLPRAGLLLADSKFDIGEAIALIRKDSRGCRVVHVIEDDPHRVRSTVMRHTRGEPSVGRGKKSDIK